MAIGPQIMSGVIGQFEGLVVVIYTRTGIPLSYAIMVNVWTIRNCHRDMDYVAGRTEIIILTLVLLLLQNNMVLTILVSHRMIMELLWYSVDPQERNYPKT